MGMRTYVINYSILSCYQFPYRSLNVLKKCFIFSWLQVLVLPRLLCQPQVTVLQKLQTIPMVCCTLNFRFFSRIQHWCSAHGGLADHHSEHSDHLWMMNDSIAVAFSLQFYHNLMLVPNWISGYVCYLHANDLNSNLRISIFFCFFACDHHLMNPG